MTPAITFHEAVLIEAGITTTENGAPCHSTCFDAVVDFFGKGGACRHNPDMALDLFIKAYEQDPKLALQTLFYFRDPRGGQGERKVFRHILRYIAEQPGTERLLEELVPLVSGYGRWDDLLCLLETEAGTTVLTTITKQLAEDKQSDKPSLLAKWLPSVNASSKETRRLGRLLAERMGLTERRYRKLLTGIRAKIRLVETQMCQGDWESIDFQAVPSRAAMIYRSAFSKHQSDRYSQYLKDVAEGKAKINASVLFPYDIVGRVIKNIDQEDATLEAQWNALPDFMPTEGFNGLVVADVSGSMTGRPMDVAISLAMYVAERNTSEVWKDKFFTFSEHPQLQMLEGDTLTQRVRNLSRADWGMNTDLNSVFQQILDAAMRQGLPASEMPKQLIVVSDMQFDEGTSRSDTNFDAIRKMYARAGYEMPKLTWWNVRASIGMPATIHDSGSHFVSGCSPSVLQGVLNDELIEPIQLVRETVQAERYAPIEDAYNLAVVWGDIQLFSPEKSLDKEVEALFYPDEF